MKTKHKFFYIILCEFQSISETLEAISIKFMNTISLDISNFCFLSYMNLSGIFITDCSFLMYYWGLGEAWFGLKVSNLRGLVEFLGR